MKATKRRIGRPRVKARRENFTVRLIPEHRAGIEAKAAEKGVTPTAIIQMAVAEFLKRDT